MNLAVSLHAVRDDLRDELVPLNRKYPIAEVLAACRRYPGSSNARRITFEYIMLKGVNDSEAEARELVRLIAGMPAKVNLIPFNPWPGSRFETSGKAALDRFARDRERGGVCFADPDAARAGYPGGVRAVADGEPTGESVAVQPERRSRQRCGLHSSPNFALVRRWAVRPISPISLQAATR